MIKRLAHRNANVQIYTLEVKCAPMLEGNASSDMEIPARKCSIAKLWLKSAHGISVKKFYGRPAEAGQR